MSGLGTGPQRVRMPYVEWLAETLSARDWAIVGTVYLIRLASGRQLERLYFGQLAGRSRSVMRWRVLKRLVDARVLTTLDRRIGTSHHGSRGLRYALDTGGQRLIRLRANRESLDIRIRRPRLPGERFVAHTLAVTELYVTLVERSRLGGFVLETFQADAAAYWPNGLGGWLKPDALVALRGSKSRYYWWYEADLATESLPTMRGKLGAYLDFVHRGQLGPHDVVPWVLIGVPDAKRQAAVQSIVNQLPAPAGEMFLVARMADAINIMIDELMKE